MAPPVCFNCLAEAEKEQEDVLKRESLLNNAWRERAYEKLAVTPVR
jgi:DNA-binding winged helix-turn-helix (wHTH) protein